MRKLMLIVSVFVLFGITGCSSAPEDQANMKAYENVSKKHHYRTGDYDEITNSLKNLEPGYYVFGFEGSMDTHRLVEAFDKVMKDKKIESYFIDIDSDEFTPLAQRRMDEFYNAHANESMFIDRWPSIIVVEGGQVSMFSLNGVSETVTADEIKSMIEIFMAEA